VPLFTEAEWGGKKTAAVTEHYADDEKQKKNYIK
jgi:hypothetical protein